MQLKVSIIILNYKSPQLTKQAVAGIFDHPPNSSYEIIVLDNNSKDNCQEVLDEAYDFLNREGCAFIQLKKNVGYGRANNIGIQKAQGEYVLILNPDTVIFDTTIDALVDYADRHTDVGMVGPQVLNPDKTRQDSCFRFPTFMYPFFRRTFLAKTRAGKKWIDWFLMKDKSIDWSESRSVDWLLGACLLVRGKAIHEVGLLDERFFLFLEDTDWAYRFWQARWKVVYYPKSTIVHYPHRASSETGILRHICKRTAWIHLSSWIKFYFKNIWKNTKYVPGRR